MKDRIFSSLQRVGRSLMLPISLLPVAGILLGIGESFTNETTLATYHLTGIIYPVNWIYVLLTTMKVCGSAVFSNIALIFAVGVAIGMSRKEKAVGALAAMISYIVFNMAMSSMIDASGGIDAFESSMVTTVLGMPTLQMGVFGGIIVGLGVAGLNNRFYNIELPSVFSFFGGSRFVPIISVLVFLFVGMGMFFVWPIVQTGIGAIAKLVAESGYVGTFFYGLANRLLLPFGLHHMLNIPFWQTSLGGTMVVDGVTVSGAQNILFAQLASPNTTHFSVDAARFLSGAFPVMMFGVPGAALATYRCAKPENRKKVAGLLLSASVAAIVTGVTEPFEFTFLFVAPALFVVHAVLTGISYMLMHILNVAVFFTFSAGLIDFTLFGVLLGNEATGWVWVVIVGIVYFFVYYAIFRFLIKKMNYKTPGREDADEEAKLYTKADFKKKTGIGSDSTSLTSDEGSADDGKGRKGRGKSGKSADQTSALILAGLGGLDNVEDVDACATRLRVTIANPDEVSEKLLKASGALGVIHKGKGVQVIYGPQVENIKSKLIDFMDTDEAAQCLPESFEADEVAEGAVPVEKAQKAADIADAKDSAEAANVEDVATTSTTEALTLYAYATGEVIPLEEVQDDVFSQKLMGDGIAIEPVKGALFAPVDATVEMMFHTNHAIGLATSDGVELLLHIGIDTVKLEGQHFISHVEEGEAVKRGDLLISFNMDEIKKAGYPVTIPVIITDMGSYKDMNVIAQGEVAVGDKLLSLS